jgi:hypothetical protein
MKKLIKKLLRPLWRMSAPARRVLVAKFDGHMTQLLASCFAQFDHAPSMELALTNLVRELARLQTQVEILQQEIGVLQQASDRVTVERRLSVVGEAD